MRLLFSMISSMSGFSFHVIHFLKKKVLIKFHLQLHELTTNAISQISVFAMTLRMQGLTPHAEVFVCYYQIHVAKKKVSKVDGIL